MTTALRVACVQMRSGLDRRDNLDASLAQIAAAAEEGARLIATPEMTNVVDRDPKRLLADLPGEEGLFELDAYRKAAAAHQAWLLIGSMALKADERRAFNRAYLFSPEGEIAARYDKLHMFDVDLPNGESWKESRLYAPGERAVMGSTPFAKIGLTICYDVRFPSLYRALAKAGASLFAAPAAFTAQTGRAHWSTLLRARAIECGAFVIAPAQGGRHEDGRETYGHSMIIGPWGEILGALEHDEPGVLVADLALEEAAEARRRIPNLTLEREYAIAER